MPPGEKEPLATFTESHDSEKTFCSTRPWWTLRPCRPGLLGYLVSWGRTDSTPQGPSHSSDRARVDSPISVRTNRAVAPFDRDHLPSIKLETKKRRRSVARQVVISRGEPSHDLDFVHTAISCKARAPHLIVLDVHRGEYGLRCGSSSTRPLPQIRVEMDTARRQQQPGSMPALARAPGAADGLRRDWWLRVRDSRDRPPRARASPSQGFLRLTGVADQRKRRVPIRSMRRWRRTGRPCRS